MQTVIMIGQLLLGLSILVAIHEFGHFLAAKAFGMRVDKFFIFFDFGKKKLFSFKKGDTEYGIGWFPIGGYVKIAGMVDESFDTEFADKPPQPWEFRAKSTTKKVFVLIAGVLMNLLLTIAIFWGINYFQGKQVIQTTQIGIVPDSTSVYNLGFRSKDKIIDINNKNVANWDDVMQNLLLAQSEKVDVEVQRGNEIVHLQAASISCLKSISSLFYKKHVRKL